MFLRLLRESFLRRRRRQLVALAALALGTGVSMASLTVALDIGDKVSRELRSFGANIVVRPRGDTLPVEIGGVDLRPLSEGSFLREEEIPKLKTIFWRHHILAVAPFLFQGARLPNGESVVLVGTWFEKKVPLEDGAEFVTGLKTLNAGWQFEGAWPGDDCEREAMVGRELAGRFGWRPGDWIPIGLPGAGTVELFVRGTVSTGGDEDRQILVPLAWLQRVAGHAGLVRRLQINALVSPEDEFARRNPQSMSPAEFDRWYCTPYVSAIAHQIEDVLADTEAAPIHRVAQAESAILLRVERLLAAVSLAALLGAALVVLSAMTTTVLERRREIAVMKAMGADNLVVSGFFLSEAALLGLAGGLLGYVGGLAGAQGMARSVFGSGVAVPPVLLPVIIGLGLGAALLGTLLPLRTVERTDPALALREK
jgi:putative ABC transport system permease protein